MSIVRKVAKNIFFILTGNIIERIIGFFVLLILVRYLGSGDFGKYSLIYAFINFFQIFTAMGIDCVILRELSRDFKRGTEFISSAVTLKLLFSLIGILLCWIILQWMHYPADIKLLIYIASLGMLFSFGTLFNNVFQAKLLMASITGITIATKILLGILTIVFILLKASLFYFIFINLLVYIVQIITTYYFSKRFLIFRVKMNLGVWKELLKHSWPLIFITIFVSIYTRIDQIILFHFKGKEELGFYASAVKLVELPLLVVSAFLLSAFPLFSKYAITSLDSFRRAYEACLKYLMIFFAAIAMMTTLFSKQIILVCFGENFLPSQKALAILVWSTLFVSAGVVNTFLLLATDLQHLDIVFMGFLATVNFILNLTLIPRYGFTGAAIAAVISYGLLIPLFYLLKRTRMFAKAIVKSMLKPIFATLVSGYLVHTFFPFPSVFKLILVGFIYLFLLLFIKGIDSQDIRYAKELLIIR